MTLFATLASIDGVHLLPQGPFNVFNTIAEAEAEIKFPFLGMEVWIISEDDQYIWKGSPPSWQLEETGGGSSTTITDNYIVENIPSENTSGVDYTLTNKLTYVPADAADVELTLNGVVQRQGGGEDYIINGATRQITWLGATGTGLPLDTLDEIMVGYFLSVGDYLVENIPSENTSGVDYTLINKLTYVAANATDIELTLNGIVQRQGAGEDYTLDGSTGQIIWLGATGTGLSLDTLDEIMVGYFNHGVLTS